MDQGIIGALKVKYRLLAIRKLILVLEKKETIPKFSIFSAMYMLKKAWDAISNQTCTNCFRKLGISKKDAVKVMNDEEDHFKGLGEDVVEEDPVQTFNFERKICWSNCRWHFTWHFDIEVSTSHGKLTNTKIIAEEAGTQEDNSDDKESNNVESKPIIKQGIEEVQKAFGVLEDFSLYSKFGEAMMRSLKELKFNVEKGYAFNKKQTLISDFFLKQ